MSSHRLNVRVAAAVAATVLSALAWAGPQTSARTPAPGAALPLDGEDRRYRPGPTGATTATQLINHLIWNGREREACDTTGNETDSGYTEAQFNFNVASYLAADLRAEGAKVVMTRTSNDGVGPCVPERSQIIDRAHADVAIDIHADGGPAGGAASRSSSRSRTDRTTASSPARRRSANPHQGLPGIARMPVSDYDGTGGVSYRDNLAGLNLTTVPKVLIECGNMRNSTDAAMLVRAAPSSGLRRVPSQRPSRPTSRRKPAESGLRGGRDGGHRDCRAREQLGRDGPERAVQRGVLLVPEDDPFGRMTVDGIDQGRDGIMVGDVRFNLDLQQWPVLLQEELVDHRLP